jgi:hypothetical protein
LPTCCSSTIISATMVTTKVIQMIHIADHLMMPSSMSKGGRSLVGYGALQPSCQRRARTAQT